MREVPLTKGAVALVDDEDYERIAAHRWYLSGSGYAARGGGGTPMVQMHREVLGFPATQHVDHVNGQKLNNTRANLRGCSAAENQRNRRTKRSSIYKGVWRHGSCNRWQAEIRVAGGRRIHLGLHKTPEEAGRAYDRAAIEHFGEFARLNFPESKTA